MSQAVINEIFEKLLDRKFLSLPDGLDVYTPGGSKSPHNRPYCLKFDGMRLCLLIFYVPQSTYVRNVEIARWSYSRYY